MATKKKAGASASAGKKTASKSKSKSATPPPQHTEAYEAALEEYGEALELLRKDDPEGALAGFDALIEKHGHEPELVDRARTYRTICARRLAGPGDEPGDKRGRYYRAIVLANEGRLEEAIEILSKIIAAEPEDAASLYARASALALQGRSEPAVADLRKAVSIEPTIRFQAVNDPDFDRVRDDAAFIDVIEPTPTGA